MAKRKLQPRTKTIKSICWHMFKTNSNALLLLAFYILRSVCIISFLSYALAVGTCANCLTATHAVCRTQRPPLATLKMYFAFAFWPGSWLAQAASVAHTICPGAHTSPPCYLPHLCILCCLCCNMCNPLFTLFASVCF